MMKNTLQNLISINKNIIIMYCLLVMMLVIILIGCSSGEMNTSKDNDVDIETIVNLIEEKDREGIKNLFSSQALSDAENIDEGIDYLLSLFESEIIEIDGIDDSIVDESVDFSNKIVQAKSFFNLVTDGYSYKAFLLEYHVDTENEENIGLYSLRIIPLELEDTHFSYWQDMIVPGIYIPNE